MADTLTTWTYTGTDEVSLTWTRDGQDVKVTDTAGNSYTYTIDGSQHFTKMTLIKDGAAVEWPENTAYKVSGADKVELSGTIVTATTMTTILKVVTITDGAEETAAEAVATNETGETNYTIAGSGFLQESDAITVMAVYDSRNVIFSYTKDLSSYGLTNAYAVYDGTREELFIGEEGIWQIYRPGIGTYGEIDVVIELETLSSTFTLYHDNQS